jgi:hypothetical protein
METFMLLELERQTTQLTEAQVLQAAGNRVQLELPDELVWARSALASPYEIAVGDQVLAIGQQGTWYVIGVLRGSGKTTFVVPGDLAIQAPRGSVELAAAKGICIKSPDVSITAQRLELAARMVFESFVQATRWVKEAFQVRAGRMRARVESTYDVKAGRILERAEGDVKIDGRKIHLG